MLSLTQVALTYGSGRRAEFASVMEPLDLELASGTVLGVVGPNGAGKTSLLNAIAGIGRVTGARRLDGEALSAGVSRHLSFVAAEPVLIERMTVADFLVFDASLRQVEFTEQDVKEVIERFDCTEFADRQIRHCSLGMKKRAALAAAWLGNPRVILLDEPINGLDTVSIYRLEHAIAEHVSRGGIMVISGHILTFIQKVANRVILLESGKIVKDLSQGNNLEAIFYEIFIEKVRGL